MSSPQTVKTRPKHKELETLGEKHISISSTVLDIRQLDFARENLIRVEAFRVSGHRLLLLGIRLRG